MLGNEYPLGGVSNPVPDTWGGTRPPVPPGAPIETGEQQSTRARAEAEAIYRAAHPEIGPILDRLRAVASEKSRAINDARTRILDGIASLNLIQDDDGLPGPGGVRSDKHNAFVALENLRTGNPNSSTTQSIEAITAYLAKNKDKLGYDSFKIGQLGDALKNLNTNVSAGSYDFWQDIGGYVLKPGVTNPLAGPSLRYDTSQPAGIDENAYAGVPIDSNPNYELLTGEAYIKKHIEELEKSGGDIADYLNSLGGFVGSFTQAQTGAAPNMAADIELARAEGGAAGNRSRYLRQYINFPEVGQGSQSRRASGSVQYDQGKPKLAAPKTADNLYTRVKTSRL